MQCLVPQTELDIDTVKTILGEYRISNADVVLKYDANADDLIDVIEGNRIYTPCIYILNKIDQISIEELEIIYKVPHCVPISAHHKVRFHSIFDIKLMINFLFLFSGTLTIVSEVSTKDK